MTGRFIGIMGPGRCGSSAVAGVMQHAGVPMGKELIGPHPQWNAKGHYEDRHMHWLNRLVAYRLEYSDAIRRETLAIYPDLRDHAGTMASELRTLYRQALAERERHPVWAMKCIMLGLIYPHIESLLPEDRRLIVVHRDREAIIRSRMRHSDLSRDEALNLTYQLAGAVMGVASTASCRVLHVQYEELCAQPRREVTRILDFVNESRYADLDYAAAIASIEPEMDHAGAYANHAR